MERQILIKTAEAWFEFSKSRTGQIDFVGKVSEMLKEDELREGGYQKIASSAYFTPSCYIYLQEGENANPFESSCASAHSAHLPGTKSLVSILYHRKVGSGKLQVASGRTE